MSPRPIQIAYNNQMLEICVTMEINQHPTLSINVDTFPSVEDDSTLKSEDKGQGETNVNNDLDDLECIFGDSLVASPPTLEQGFQQNEIDDFFGQTQEENKDEDKINLMG